MDKYCVICGEKLSGLKTVTCGSEECLRRRNTLEMQRYRKENPEIIRRINQRGWAKYGASYLDRKKAKKNVDLISCAICGRSFEFIGRHLKTHSITVGEYQEKYPKAQMMTEAMRVTRGKGSIVQSKHLSYDGKVVDGDLYEFLAGTLLGDGGLELPSNKLNARYRESAKNHRYMQWKYQFLSKYFYCTLTEHLAVPHPKSGLRYQGWRLGTSVHPLLTEWKNEWYQPKKIVARSLVQQYLTPFALALWFYDDGCVVDHGAFLYTMAFSYEDTIWLRNLLAERFELVLTVLENKHKQPYLRISSKSMLSFLSLIAPYDIPGMEYKHNGDKWRLKHGKIWTPLTQ